MNSQELRSLQEAYLEVVYNQQQLAEELQGKAGERGEQLLKKTKGKPNSFKKNSRINWLLGKSKQHPSHEYGTVSRSAEEKGQSRAPKQTKAKKGQTKKQGVKTLGGGGGNVGTYGMPQKDTLPRGKGNKAARRAGKSVEDTRKEDFEFWVHNLLDEGYDLSDYTWDEMYEFYLDEESGDYDIFDIVLDYIFEEELVDTLEEALCLMSEELDEDDVDFILDEAFKSFPEKKVSRKIQREKDRLSSGMDRADKASGSQIQGRQGELNAKRARRIMKMNKTMSDKTFTSPKERSKMNARSQKTTRTMDRIRDNQTGSDTYKGRPQAFGLDPKLKSKKKEEQKKSESISTTNKRKSIAVKAARAMGKVVGKVAKKLSK
jgi:hypothetical protein